MGYLYQELGAEIAIAGESNLEIAKLQLAINRIITGAFRDRANLTQGQRALVESDDVKTIKITGILGEFTALQFRFAKNIAGVQEPVTLTTSSQIATAIDNLTRVANERGYPGSSDSVRLGGAGGAGAIRDLFGGDRPEKGLPIGKLAIGAVALGLGIMLYRRSRRP